MSARDLMLRKGDQLVDVTVTESREEFTGGDTFGIQWTAKILAAAVGPAPWSVEVPYTCAGRGACGIWVYAPLSGQSLVGAISLVTSGGRRAQFGRDGSVGPYGGNLAEGAELSLRLDYLTTNR